MVTNKKAKCWQLKLLKELNLLDYFSIVVGGDTLSERKPSPEPLWYVAEILGVAPENMLMVGDSHNDLLAAKAAGCLSVGVTFGYGNMAQLACDDATCPDLIVNKLPEIYENLRPSQPKD